MLAIKSIVLLGSGTAETAVPEKVTVVVVEPLGEGSPWLVIVKEAGSSPVIPVPVK